MNFFDRILSRELRESREWAAAIIEIGNVRKILRPIRVIRAIRG